MKIIVLGKNGQVGWELQRTLAPLGQVIALGRQELELSNEQAIRQVVRDISPDLIINAAAYTAVDRAEEEPDLAMAINGTAPGIIAEEAARCQAALIHYSTDYVFDGNQERPYTEEDRPNPINVYGKSKLAGEEAIRRTGVKHLIFRTSWVYSLRGKNFLLTILRLARDKEELSIVNDQFGAPTWSRMIALATAQVIAISGGKINSSHHSLYHLSSAGQTTWHDFAAAILADSSRFLEKLPVLKAISTAEYPVKAARPHCSLLDNSLFQQYFHLNLPDWKSSLDLVLDDLWRGHA